MKIPFRALQNFARRLVKPPVPTLSSLDAYARWAEAYPPRAHNALMEAEEQAMLDLLPPLSGAHVLDLASGTGRYGLLMRARGVGFVVSVDNSAAMLTANPLAGRVQASMERVPLASASVNGVVCALAVGHLPVLTTVISEIGRVLKPGGWALVSDVHPLIALNGGQRTFTVGGQTFAVEHHLHLYSHLHDAADHAGLHIDAVREPSVSERLGVPVVIVYRLRKASA